MRLILPERQSPDEEGNYWVGLTPIMPHPKYIIKWRVLYMSLWFDGALIYEGRYDYGTWLIIKKLIEDNERSTQSS